MGKENYTNVLLEDINGKFDLLVELVTPLTKLPAAVAHLQNSMEDVKSARSAEGLCQM